MTSAPVTNNSFANIASDEFTYKKLGAFGEEIYIHRFRTTFKDTNNVGKTIHHPTFAVWMGKLRELSLSHLSSDLIPDMMSGQWGMVTNNSYIKIINDDVKSLDLVEGHFWINKIYGKFNSTVDLAFEWFKVEANGSLSPIAYTFLPTTWVKIIDANVVEVYPFPAYLQKWIDDAVLKNNNKDYLEEIKNYQARYDVGKLLYKNDNFLDKKKVLCKSSFYTSLEESNLVGNIYYSNYYKWQAKVVDQFIHGIDPEFYSSNTN
jgi:hypothetical protein